jgi:site-specific DNA-cytosine methylase
VHTPKITPHVSLCSGYEGIGLGLKRVIPNLRTCAYVEREAFAVANLVDKIEKGLLDAAPIYPDVTTFPYREFYPLMGGSNSICTFGFPCQPHSCAGKREGASDERWLFDSIADGLALMRPRRVFIENVTGLLTSRMPSGQLCIDYIFARLAGIGYKMADHQEEPLIEICSAAECGAPHSRKRVFILGELADHPWSRSRRLPEPAQRDTNQSFDRSSQRGVGLANPSGQRSRQIPKGQQPGQPLPEPSGETGMADTKSGKDQQRGTGELAGQGGSRWGQHTTTGAGSENVGNTPEQPQRESTDPTHAVTDQRRALLEPRRTSSNGTLADSFSEGCEGSQRGGTYDEPGEAAHGPASECGDLPAEELANTNHTAATRQRGNGGSIPGQPEPEGFGLGSWPARPGQLQHPWEASRVVRVYLDLLQISERNGLDYDTVIEAFTRGFKRGVGGSAHEHPPGLAAYIRAYSTRVDQLRAAGNGCVPATVELAWRLLSERLER